MEAAALILFLLVYLGMILGSWPGLALDRTGIALLGGIAFIELQEISLTQAAEYIDFPALTILFSFMIISAQFYFSGFYTHVMERMEKWPFSPSQFLFVVMLLSALLSAALINDIVCLAMTPLVTKVCLRKKLNPIPFLIGLACASNIGSALTLVGNPQNLLIGQVLSIPFSEYFKFSSVPCALALAAAWCVIKFRVKNDWFDEGREIHPETIAYNPWQSKKGIFVVALLLIIFFTTDLPRDRVSLAAAGIFLLSRKMQSHTMLSLIDWQLLVLFIGLFIVNGSFLSINDPAPLTRFLASYHIDLNSPFWILLIGLILSNIVSNVPAVMLLLPFVKSPENGSLLALSSTFAGNLTVVGSIANIIVISQAARYGVQIDWKTYGRIGLPVTLLSFIIIFGWTCLFCA